MKLITRLQAAVNGALNSLEATKSGANGLFVSRKVLNAEEWAAWAKAAGVPNPVPAEELHVTVICSSIDAKIPLDCCSIVVPTMGSAWDQGKFAFLGKDDNALCFVFSNWALQDRHYAYRSAGAVSAWPDYLSHLTLSMDAKGFDLPDEALANVPQYILLGAEVRADLKVDDPTEGDAGLDDDDLLEEDAETLIIVVELAQKAASDVLAQAEKGEVSVGPAEISVLRAMSHGKGVSRAAARHIAKSTWAPDLLKTVMDKTSARGLKPPSQRDEAKTQEVNIAITQISGEVAKNLGSLPLAKGYDEERRWVYGIANVSTVGGELVEDLGGDSFTTKCLEDYAAALVTSGVGGDFEHDSVHEDDPSLARNQIVQALVFTTDLQKSLGIDLGMEFLLTVTHVPGDEDWEMVKKGEWMQSIAGIFFYED